MNPTDLVARYMSAWNQTDAFLEGLDCAESAPGGSMLKQVVGSFGPAQPRP
jgi:hypothetical protein